MESRLGICRMIHLSFRSRWISRALEVAAKSKLLRIHAIKLVTRVSIHMFDNKLS